MVAQTLNSNSYNTRIQTLYWKVERIQSKGIKKDTIYLQQSYEREGHHIAAKRRVVSRQSAGA